MSSAVDNPELVERFETAQRELVKAEQDRDHLNTSFNEAESSMAERNASWNQAVDSVVAKLNHAFETYMKALQYQGRVELKRTATIDSYEICMKVSFRAEEAISELSGQRHSGGERAESTIMYLMSLEELTASPFRVVDEINQGMDERNERLVFDRIVSSCCDGTYKPQYFLVSPKLLQGLRAMDNDNVTALMVWNAGGVMAQWQLPEMIQALKHKRKLLQEDMKSNGLPTGFTPDKKRKL